jgi:molybdate transport repressor ModE-like protein
MLDLNRLRVLAAVARTGSVTAAARELHYSQPSVSHHLARLEAETGAQLIQRVGRGIRLTEAGQVLAERAVEILGRLDSASAELDGYVGLSAGRLRVASYSSAVVALLPPVAAVLERDHPGLRLEIVDTHPPEALELLRAGEVDAAIVFRYDESADDPNGIRLQFLRDDPTYLLTLGKPSRVREHRDDTWVGGCDRCREHMIDICEREGFEPKIAFSTDDMVAIQALVAAGMGVATIPGLALEAHRHPALTATEIPGATRHVYLALYGDPPDPPPIAALRDALAGLPV